MKGFRQKAGDIFRNKFVRYGLMGSGLILGGYIIWRIWFVVIFSLNVHWHDGLYRYNIAVANAVNRALLLDDVSLGRTLIFGDHGDRFCTKKDIKSGGASNYGRCRVVGSATEERCGKILYNPECRTLTVSRDLWESENVRKRIIYAALNPCEYLIDEKKNESQKLIEGSRAPVMVRQSVTRSWHYAGCDIWPVSKVFIEIYEIEQSIRFSEHKSISIYSERNLISIYKAYRKNGKTGGNYVRL